MGRKLVEGGRYLIRPKDRPAGDFLRAGLLQFAGQQRHLPGIRDPEALDVLVAQLVESVRRIVFVQRLVERDISPRRADPSDDIFDPLRAAVFHQRRGDIDEAFWLVFLFVHFGKHRTGGWRYAREIYGRFGASSFWDWPHVSADPEAFRCWLAANVPRLRRQHLPGGFGNHRKYQSLDAHSPTGTGAAVVSYVGWVAPLRTHQELVRNALQATQCHPRRAFDELYRSMVVVAGFGRVARFDYLAMIGKLGLAPIEPYSAYLTGSTGPLAGARLLFTGDVTSRISARELDASLVDLECALGVGFQVLEDALCNWQKSPYGFMPFRG